MAVLAVAALCLHQLTYLVSFGEHSGSVLEGSGHGYLGIAGPLLVTLALCGVAASVVVAARARPRTARSPGPGWLVWTGVLLVIFAVQESGEVLLRTGSLDQLVTLMESSGAVALIAALGVGRLVALALSGLRVLDARLAEPAPRARRTPATFRLPAAHSPLHFPRLNLAFGFARRPPPPTAR